MSQVANNPGEFLLGALNDNTGWLVFDEVVEDVAFNIVVSGFNGTITMQVSNQSDYTKTRYSTVTTYTAAQAPLNIPYAIGRYVRFIMTIWASGTAYIGIAKGKNAQGQRFNIAPQGATDSPTGQYA